VSGGAVGGGDLGGGGAGLAGVEQGAAVVVDSDPGDEAEVVPALDGELVDAEVGGDLCAGEHATFLQVGDLVGGGEVGGGDGGSAGAGLAGVEQGAAAVVGLDAGEESELVPAFGGEGVHGEVGGDLVEGEHAGGLASLGQGGEVVEVAVVADSVGGEGPAGAVGEAGGVEGGGGLAVGVGVEECVEDGQGGFGGACLVPTGHGDGDGEGVVLAAG